MTKYALSVGLAVAVLLSGGAALQSAMALDEATCKKIVDCSPVGLTKAKLTEEACKTKFKACIDKKADEAGDRKFDPSKEKPPTIK